MPSQKKAAVWRAVALGGLGLNVIGIGGLCIDYIAVGGVEFVDEHIQFFLLAILLGALALYVGLIGWAKSLDRPGRVTMGAALFIAPIAVCLLASMTVGTNVHGPFFLIFLPLLPISVIGLVLLLFLAASPAS